MAYRDILYDVSENIATITLNRPDKLNAWTPTMGGEIRAALEAAVADPAVRVIILTGAGRGFCAGADMNDLTEISAAGTTTQRAFTPFDERARADFHHAMTYLPSVQKPIIGAINGVAAGLGFAMLLFCDLRFSADTAAFVTSFARRGLIAEHGTSWMLTRLVGHARAMDLMLSSRKVTADEAYRIGLVDRVASDVMAEARGYARDLAHLSSPRSLGVIKRQLWNSLFQGLQSAMKDADAEMTLSLKTDDFREGVAHFLEKRAPRFTGT
jgi:enoyl-CoA hydratase/carnithine racemase